MADLRGKYPFVVQTAPERIYLTVSDESYDADMCFPDDHENVCWCEDEAVDVCVPYVRADVAAANIATLEAQLAAEKKLSEAISRDCNECANQRNDALARLAKVEGERDSLRKEVNKLTYQGVLKTCSICIQAKDRGEFYKRSAYCKACHKERDKGRVRHTNDRDTNSGDKAKQRKRKWKDKGLFLAHERARRLVRYAVSTGKMVRPDNCSDCGGTSMRRDGVTGIQAHHKDHTKPYEVEWLCPKCHTKADAAITASQEEG